MLCERAKHELFHVLCLIVLECFKIMWKFKLARLKMHANAKLFKMQHNIKMSL